MSITRREFLKVGSLIGAAATLAACRPGPGPTLFPTSTSTPDRSATKDNINAKLIQDLRDLTGITPDTNQDQLAQFAYDKTFRHLLWYYDPLPNGQPLVTPIIQSHFADFTVNGVKK